jgi:TP901 family phage tail tape measure protein
MDIVEILVTGKNLSRPALDEATAGARGLGGVMGKMATISSEALVGIAVASVKMAATFQSSTTRLITSAGESTKNIDMVRKGMLDMAGQVGVKAEELSKAMYYVEAAGFHAADGLTVLKAAAQGAAAEGADTTTVAKALTDILVDYHLKASSAADVTSKMVAAISHGKTNLQDFSGAFANIVPAASAAGISMNDVMAALANMTNHGFTASRAASNLAQALRSLLNPTKPMQKAFAEFGVTTAQLREKMKGPNGLTDAMEFLSKAAEKAGKEGTPAFAAALKQLMGTAPGANAALSTVGENFAATSATIRAVGGATADSAGKVQGFAEVQKTLGQQVKQLTASFDSLMIELGNKLIPIVTALISAMSSHKDVVLGVLAAVAALMGVLVVYSVTMKTIAAVQAIAAVATKVWTAAVWLFNLAMDADPIVLVAIAIAALVAGIVYAYMHFTVFRDVINDVFKVVKTIVMTYIDLIILEFKLLVFAAELVWKGLQAAWNGIVGAAKAVGSFLASTWHSISSTVSTVWGGIAKFFEKWWPLLLIIFAFPIGVLVAIWNHFHKQIISAAETAWGYISGFFVSIWHFLESAAKIAWSAIQVAIIRPIETVWGWLVSAWGTISGWLGAAWRGISRVAASVWHSVASAVTGPMESAWHALTSIGGKIISAISGAFNSAWKAVSGIGSKFLSIGGDIISGIINGVEGAAGSLFSTMENIASGALKAAKSFLGIGSPSKRAAAEIGHWLPPGIAEGALRNAPVAHAAMQKLSSGLLSSGRGALAASGAAGVGAGGGAQTIVLEIHSGGSSFDNALVEILRNAIRIRGGNVQIALGRS